MLPQANQASIGWNARSACPPRNACNSHKYPQHLYPDILSHMGSGVCYPQTVL